CRRARKFRHRRWGEKIVSRLRPQRQESLTRLHVRVRQDVVDRLNRRARHTNGEKACLDVGEIVCGHPGPDHIVDRLPMLQARSHGGKTWVVRRLGSLNRLAEPYKWLVASPGKGDPFAVSGGVNVGG